MYIAIIMPTMMYGVKNIATRKAIRKTLRKTEERQRRKINNRAEAQTEKTITKRNDIYVMKY